MIVLFNKADKYWFNFVTSYKKSVYINFNKFSCGHNNIINNNAVKMNLP